MNEPSGTVTFLFTDIEGSTQLWQTAPEAMPMALERHDAVVRSAVQRHGGYVFSTGGDGFAVAFARAGDAIAAAVEAQAGLTAEPWPESASISVRMGLHTGEVVERDGDYFGTPVNRCARLMAIGHGGQILVSEATEHLVRGALPEGPVLVDLGEHRLRDLSEPLRVFQLGEGVFAPLRSVDVVPGNLPTVLTELVGRGDTVARLVELVASERLVTLTGVGGIGKTRLSVAVAAAVSPRFADGCWFVELAPSGSGDEVIQAVAAAMGTPVNGQAALARYLSDRQVLLVLDNCEHVLPHAARLAQALLAAGPEVVIVATSREPLGVDGEVVRGVASLGTPDEDDVDISEALEASAVRLFVGRAMAATDQFALVQANVADVVAICRQLDGIPLAIELAAARTRAMDPAEIARRLGQRFRLLEASRGANERHRTLQAAVSWSHDLLSDEERTVFRRLAVFPGSFALEAAERVAGAEDPVEVLDPVVHLVDRSLVQYDAMTRRYRLLETLRQYAADRLGEAGETLAAREAHCVYFSNLVERYAPYLQDARYHEGVARLLPELDNLRAAATWLAETARFEHLQDLFVGAQTFLTQYAPADGVRWLKRAVEGRDSPGDQGQVDALGELAHLTVLLGEFDAALDLAERSIGLAENRGLQASQMAWQAKALGRLFTNDQQGALEAARAGLAVALARGDTLNASVLASVAVQPLASLGDLEAHRVAAEESLAMAQATGNAIAVGSAVVAGSGARLYRLHSSAPPDFAGALDILELSTDEDLAEDNTVGLWVALHRGLALLGADHRTQVSLLARCLRSADRLQMFPAAELSLRLLILGAAAGGETETAALLYGYLRANLTAYRTNAGGLVWLDERIETALGAFSPEERARLGARGATLTRRELMALVSDLERALD